MERVLLGGRYEIRELLGGGGMARVYLACDGVLERDVAIKVLREQLAKDEGFVERFRREAKSAASLNHPNIVQVYDRGETEDGRYYIVMEYVPGGTLKERIVREGHLDPDEAARLGAQVADALGAAHKRGTVHRDVKPHNVLLTAMGDAKVADFGIARAADATTISEHGAILGTAKYMSPAQAAGEHVGPASDLYSLGVVLQEALTGEPPSGESPSGAADATTKRVGAHPGPPKQAGREVPEGLGAILARLLSEKPEGRYGSAAELAEDLRRVGDGSPPGPADAETTTHALRAPAPPAAPARKVPGVPRWGPPRGKPRWALAAALAVVVLLTGLGAVGWGLRQTAGAPGAVRAVEGGPLRAPEAPGGGRLSADVVPDARTSASPAASSSATPASASPATVPAREDGGMEGDGSGFPSAGPAAGAPASPAPGAPAPSPPGRQSGGNEGIGGGGPAAEDQYR